MGYFFGFTAELLGIGLMAIAQWQIGRAAVSFANRRFGRQTAGFLRNLVIAAGAVVLLALLLSLPKGILLLPRSRLSGVVRGGALLWAFSSTCSWVIYRLLWFSTRRFDPERRKLLLNAGSVAVAAPFAAVGFGALISRTDFRVRETDIQLPDLPKDLEGLRLVQISDIHLSPFLSELEFAKVVDAANELRGHVILVTGDLISMRGDPLDACLHQISRLRSDAGILACLGNHEIYADAEDYTAAEGARLGIPFLRYQRRQIRFGGTTVNFAGVDYQKMQWSRHYLEGAERMIVPGTLNILLSHNPDVFPTAAKQGWNITVSGHTHGGQVNVEILNQDLNVARFYTPYVYGLYQIGRSSAYVTRGIGTIGMPARLGAPPEIAVLRLRKA